MADAQAVEADSPHLEAVRAYLESLQTRICDALAELEPEKNFGRDSWSYSGGGGGCARVLEGGSVIERGGVNFSHVRGDALPPSATQSRPELAGVPFEAMGVSLVIHPRNPHAPTSHANVRFFCATHEDGSAQWWFGGGFDLTPYYGYADDVRHWHQEAKNACEPFGEAVYPRLKAWCDEYFYLKHRGHCRGVGGLFFDDWNADGFERSFAFMRSVGDHYLSAYLPILEKRKDTPYTDAQRQWQCIRRGRYVEFNLVYDRGTLFGLQSGGRTESILMSMPPEVSWRYDYTPEDGTPESALEQDFLQPRDWLG